MVESFKADMPLWVLRAAFLIVAAGLGVSIAQTLPQRLPVQYHGPAYTWAVFLGVMSAAVAIIVIDVVFPRKRLDIITCVYFGIIVGLFLTYVVGIALTPIVPDIADAKAAAVVGSVRLVVGMVLCYFCVSLLMQTKDDFRFIIPYVEFAKEVKGLKPYVLDTSVIIDGRIADLVDTNVLDNQLVMPRFVLGELQGIADSGDKLRRERGRRGLDVLQKLRNKDHVDLKIYETELPEMVGQPVDMKLVILAKHLEGKIVTGDYNLNKVARLHNVPVINLNDIANSLKPVFLPGEVVMVKIIKPGESPGQGVGYLEDGTMVVVEGGRDHLSQQVRISVTSILQTSAGRMVFGKYSGMGDGQG
jgi:uncharacterized protein YacL